MTTVDEEIERLEAEAMAADSKPERQPKLFGQVVTVNVWACYLQRGAGKVPFDPAVHPADKKSIAITLEIQRIDGQVRKKDYLDWEKKWKTITLPSLRSLGLHLSRLKSRWVAIDWAPTGRTYKSGDDPNAETRQEVCFKFTEVFPDRDACEAAERMHYGNYEEYDTEVEDTIPTPTTPKPDQRNLGIQAARAMWSAAGHDEAKFKSMLQGNPNVMKHFASIDEALEAVRGE